MAFTFKHLGFCHCVHVHLNIVCYENMTLLLFCNLKSLWSNNCHNILCINVTKFYLNRAVFEFTTLYIGYFTLIFIHLLQMNNQLKILNTAECFVNSLQLRHFHACFKSLYRCDSNCDRDTLTTVVTVMMLLFDVIHP